MSAVIIEGRRFTTPHQAELALEFGLSQLKELDREIHLKFEDVSGRTYQMANRDDFLRELEHHLLLLASTPAPLKA